VPLNRKRGRPKFKWAEKGITEYWEMIRKNFKYSPMKEYDQEDENQREFIKTYASAATTTPKEDWSKIENTEPKWNKDKTRAGPPPAKRDEIRFYTDGSCPENSKVNEQNCAAGWGIAIFNEEGEEITTGLFGPVETKHNKPNFLGAEFGSNNTGELTAICEGLKWIIEHDETTKPIAFYYDSKYAAKITTGEYKAESNKYLAAKARTLLKQALNKRQIRFEHIKGHSKDKGNDAADELANKGATGQTCRNLTEWNNIKHTHIQNRTTKKKKKKKREP
jgi:ribonuclease HI